MSESEIAKKVTKTIKALDKLILDIQKDTKKITEALRELKENNNQEKE